MSYLSSKYREGGDTVAQDHRHPVVIAIVIAIRLPRNVTVMDMVHLRDIILIMDHLRVMLHIFMSTELY